MSRSYFFSSQNSFSVKKVTTSLGRSAEIFWEGLSVFVEGNDYVCQWHDYYIGKHLSRERPDGTGFIIFNRNEKYTHNDFASPLRRDLDTGCKLHVALNREDIQAAFNPILQVLREYEINCFKIISESNLDKLLAQGQLGKIFTIYVAGFCKDKIRALALAINDALLKLKIALPEQCATDCEMRKDEAIPGCDFVTLAYPRQDRMRVDFRFTHEESLVSNGARSSSVESSSDESRILSALSSAADLRFFRQERPSVLPDADFAPVRLEETMAYFSRNLE